MSPNARINTYATGHALQPARDNRPLVEQERLQPDGFLNSDWISPSAANAISPRKTRLHPARLSAAL